MIITCKELDSALDKWFNVDPLAEKSRRFSTYTYCLDNPVYFIDPSGMEAEASNVDAEAEIEGKKWNMMQDMVGK